MAMTYNGGASRWRLAVTPATPSGAEVVYADTAGSASSVSAADVAIKIQKVE
jgi:hypothetical protein